MKNRLGSNWKMVEVKEFKSNVKIYFLLVIVRCLVLLRETQEIMDFSESLFRQLHTGDLVTIYNKTE